MSCSVFLQKLQDRDPSERRNAAEGLAEADERAIYPLIRLLRDESTGVQDAAMRSLIAIGGEVTGIHGLAPAAGKPVPTKHRAHHPSTDRAAVRAAPAILACRQGRRCTDLCRGPHLRHWLVRLPRRYCPAARDRPEPEREDVRSQGRSRPRISGCDTGVDSRPQGQRVGLLFRPRISSRVQGRIKRRSNPGTSREPFGNGCDTPPSRHSGK